MQLDRPIAIALILFAVLLIGFFLVSPEYKKFKTLQAELGLKKAEFNAQVDYYAMIAKVHSQLKEHEEDIKKIDNALSGEPSLGRLIYFFQKTASENGMMLKDLFLSKSADKGQNSKGGIKDIAFSVDILGDYLSLQNFIIALEKSDRIFEITDITFGSSGSESPTEEESQFDLQRIYSFNLQIKTYSY